MSFFGKLYVNGKYVCHNVHTINTPLADVLKLFKATGKTLENVYIENGKIITDPKRIEEIEAKNKKQIEKMQQGMQKMQQMAANMQDAWQQGSISLFKQWAKALANVVRKYVRLLRGETTEEQKPVGNGSIDKKEQQIQQKQKEEKKKDVKADEKLSEKEEEKPKEDTPKEEQDDKDAKIKELENENKELQAKVEELSKKQNNILCNNINSFNNHGSEIVLDEPVENKPVEDPKTNVEPPIKTVKIQEESQTNEEQHDQSEKTDNIADKEKSNTQTVKDKGNELLEKGKQTITGSEGGQGIVETVKNKVEEVAKEVKDKVADVASDTVKGALVGNSEATKNTDIVNAATNAATQLLR